MWAAFFDWRDTDRHFTWAGGSLFFGSRLGAVSRRCVYKGCLICRPLGIALNDFTTGEFLDVNGALITPTGYTREEFFSLNYWDLTPAAYEQEELEQLRLLSNHGRYGPYEKEYIRKDGSQYSVLLNGVLIENRAGRQLIWSMVEDISERKKSQRDLEESRSELQNFFDHSVNFMVILDRDGVFEKTNASFTYALGLVSSQVVGKSMFDFIHPEDVEASRLECQKNTLWGGERRL